MGGAVQQSAASEGDGTGAVVLGHVLPFRLGPLFVQPALRRLSRDSIEEFIQPRVMQVLVALVRAGGEVLTRDDLMETCWGGRIVTDDALNRIVSQVRKLAEGVGHGAFTIDTVNRVGYRLLQNGAPEHQLEAELETPRTSPPGAANGAVARSAADIPPLTFPPRRWSGRFRATLALLVPAFVTLGAAALWQSRPAPTSPMSVSLQRFEAIGPDLPQEIPLAVDTELRSRLADRHLALTNGRADFVVTGTVRQIERDQLRLTVRVEDPSTGTLVWTRELDRPIADDEAPNQFAGDTSETLHCAISAVKRHPVRLTSANLSLALRSCGERTANDTGRLLIAARKLASAQPDFYLGWAQISYAITLQGATTGQQDPVLVREATQAARRVVALQPNLSTGYVQLAQLVPADQPRQREALLRRAAAAPDLELGGAHEYLGDFLLQVGRNQEARASYRVGLDHDTNLLSAWRVAAGEYLTGRVAAGDQDMLSLHALAGESATSSSRTAALLAALWTGRWAEAAELIDADRPELQAALRDGLRALASGEAGRIGRARAVIERMSVEETSNPLVLPVLAALGGTNSVLERLEWSRRNGSYYSAPGWMPGIASPLLFDPLFRPIWFDPRFVGFLDRAGFIRYWRESRTRPDICRAPSGPGFCALL